MWKFIFLVFLSSHINGVTVEKEIADDLLLLDNKCSVDEDCITLGMAFCNPDHDCECRPEAFVFNTSQNSTCLPKVNDIGGYCEITKQCTFILGIQAECLEHKCVEIETQSITPWKSSSGNCNETSDCPDDHVCNSGFCISPSAAPVMETIETSIDASCTNDTECEEEGTACISDVCQCDKGFVPSQNLKRCLPRAKAVGDPCIESSQCVSLSGTVCENQKCKEIVIVPNVVKSIEAALPGLLIGSTCQNDEECKDLLNSTCTEHVCQCTEHFVTSLTRKSCLPKAKTEGDPCEIDKQCEDVKGSTCSKGKCVKPAIAGKKIGTSSGDMTRPTLLAGAFVLIKVFFV